MITDNISLDNLQVLIPAKDFADTIKSIFEEVLKAQNLCAIQPSSKNEKSTTNYLLANKLLKH